MLFFLLIALTNCKCLLWYQFSHTSERDGPHRENRFGGGNRGDWHADTQWAMGFGYESLDQLVGCNDLEMFNQCDRAQKIIDLYTEKNDRPIINIGCSNNIACAATLPSTNGKFWCQNMDSYDRCVSAKVMMDEMNQTQRYPIDCVFDVMLSDNIPVLNYRKSSPITTTTTTTTITTTTPMITTTVPSNTSSAITTVPSVGTILNYATYLIIFLLILSSI